MPTKWQKDRQDAFASKRYRVPYYEVVSILWLYRLLFKNVYSRSQDSKNLGARIFGAFVGKEPICMNDVLLDLHSHFDIHPIIHIMHTTPNLEQPADVAVPISPVTEPVHLPTGTEQEVEAFWPIKRWSGTQIRMFIAR